MRKIEKPTIKHDKEGVVKPQGKLVDLYYPGLEPTKYIYVENSQSEQDGFSPPTSWRILDAMGNYMYFRARDRAKAQGLCDELYGKGKYTVVSDKNGQVR